MIAHKTKAAMQGRPSHHIKSKQDQHTVPCAGGQRMSVPVMSGARIFKRCANPTISKLVGCLPNIVVLVLHNSLRVARLRSPNWSAQISVLLICNSLLIF